MLQKNISANADKWEGIGSVKAEVLDWGKEINLEFKPDIVLLADCVYYLEVC